MTRFLQALAATTLAVAAAGGALAASAAVVAPAFAASPAAPAAATVPSAPTVPMGGQTITVTAQRPTGISPQATLPCATIPAPAPASPSQSTPAACLPPHIICWLTVSTPTLNEFRSVVANGLVHCDNPVDEIVLGESLNNGALSIATDTDDPVNEANAQTAVSGGACQPATYDNDVSAVIHWPAGYTDDKTGGTTGFLNGVASFTPTAAACAPPPPAGGGGSGGPVGGCATTAPSSSAQPPADLPHLHTC